jgi:hypothetical protein
MTYFLPSPAKSRQCLGPWQLKHSSRFCVVGQHGLVDFFYLLRRNRLWPARISSIERLIVVEPDPGNMRAIRKNVEAMRSAPVLVEACVVGRHRQVHLRRGRSESAFSMEDGAFGECIRTVTFSDLLLQIADDAVVDPVKCDIEGAKKEVFASCRA